MGHKEHMGRVVQNGHSEGNNRNWDKLSFPCLELNTYPSFHPPIDPKSHRNGCPRQNAVYDNCRAF